ncbi:hypothetical protein PROFUN_02846 [Planoprotostelium fungivorum]|uniref:Transmembrane protein 188 n=1 Tax=Planoprotostelium fungivorum TaxID=1890364 RepID=A0A2P6NRW7_9EUKA|nr:hypothetical protein PROFUN_02846 [Planoprotostelium fungivorum]
MKEVCALVVVQLQQLNANERTARRGQDTMSHLNSPTSTWQVDPTTQLLDVYIFETQVKKTLQEVNRQKKNYQTVLYILSTWTICALAWYLWTYVAGEVRACQLELDAQKQLNTRETIEALLHCQRSEETDWPLFTPVNMCLLTGLLAVFSFFACGFYTDKILGATRYLSRCNQTLRTFNIYFDQKTQKLISLPRRNTSRGGGNKR